MLAKPGSADTFPCLDISAYTIFESDLFNKTFQKNDILFYR
jgi:hypothetical protein